MATTTPGLSASPAGTTPSLQFTEVTLSAGLNYEHGYVDGPTTEARMATGGVGVGDYDGDGWIDLYVVRGDIGP